MTTVNRWNIAEVAQPVGRYSLINTCHDDCELAFVAGQFGIDANGHLAGSDTRSQTKQVLHNLRAVLESLDAHPSDLLYVNTYLSREASIDDFMAERASIYEEWFNGEKGYPGSTLLVVHSLVSSDYLVEIDATVAVRRSPSSNSAHASA